MLDKIDHFLEDVPEGGLSDVATGRWHITDVDSIQYWKWHKMGVELQSLLL